MIAYITYNQMMDDIRSNLWKIPRDTDLVLSIPRSGNLVAAIITKFLNVRMMTIQDFCKIIKSGGGQEELLKNCFKGKALTLDKKFTNILVVDDTVYSGRQLRAWAEELSKDEYKDFNFKSLVVYKELDISPDIYLRDISDLSKRSIFHSVLYEWTLFYRYDIAQYIAYDLDGVMCLDPPDDHNQEAYETYIKDPIPYYIPVINPTKPTTVITYRLDKYREPTSTFLSRMGISCTLIMVDAKDRDERSRLITPWDYKASEYGNRDDLLLYIESNDYEAQLIHQLTKKPVLCISTNRLYQIEG